MTRTVRQAHESDAPAVRTVARESWHGAYDGFLGSETVDTTVDDWYAVDDLEASIADAADRSDAVFLVAEADSERDSDDDAESGSRGSGTGARDTQGELVGFVHVVPGSDGHGRTVASLVRLYVHPGCWGKGTGTALLERAIDGLETDGDGDANYERLELEVFADNEVGVRFYESRGFERTGEHEERFAGDTQPVYTYERSLEGEYE
ncbi:GNAT family N-acetyltransferase [Halomontanus rarus]|uniref:GNAT family N-acetyltransferase n=1 Tax=Halomontanus rarus TaxID=3034020 RepID=UPI001A97DE52